MANEAANKIMKAAVLTRAAPGISIAHSRYGTMPHTRPPQITNKDKALEYFWHNLTQAHVQRQVWDTLKLKNATCYGVARAILYTAALHGVIQLNLGMVILPVITDMIEAVAKAGGVPHTKIPKFKRPKMEAILKEKLKEIMLKYDKDNLLPRNGKYVGGAEATPDYTSEDQSQPDQTQGQDQSQPQSQQQPQAGLLGMAGQQQPGGGQ